MGERTSCPQRTKAKDAPQQPEPDSEEDQPSEEEEQPLEDEVERALSKEPTEVAPQGEPEGSEESGASSDEEEDAEARLVQLCDEGGVLAINFLLSKAVSPTTMDIPTKVLKNGLIETLLASLKLSKRSGEPLATMSLMRSKGERSSA